MFVFKEKFIDKKNSKLVFFVFAILILIPKIDLIGIVDYHAGIRIEDFIIVIFGIIILFNIRKYNFSSKSLAFKFTIFFPYVIFAMLNGYMHGVYQWIAIVPRYIEYIILIIFVDNYLRNLNHIILIAKLVIILNFIFGLLQKLSIVGGISSVKYYAAGDDFLYRPFGLTGGAWELGILVSISFYILLLSNKKNIISLILFFLMTIFCLLIAETRGTIIAFFIAILFINNKNISKNIIFITPILIFTIYLLRDTSVFIKILDIDLFFLFDQIKYYIQFRSVDREIFEYGSTYYSLGARLVHLLPKFNLFMDNQYLFYFGQGFMSLYFDSLILRILFSFGVVGTIIVLFLSMKLNIGILIFILLAGTTLDLFISFKILLIFSMYFKYANLLKNEKII